jgi:hypothetical protein
MNQPEQPDHEKFWTRGTRLQMIFLGIAGVAFLIGLMAIIFLNSVH